jgi:type II secretory pathway pseudopilin PulG
VSARRGISLIEVMVSLAIVFLLCIFVLNLFPSSLIAIRHGESRLDAQRVAEATLEQARALSFDLWTTGTVQSKPPQLCNGLAFTPVLTIAAVSGYPSTSLKSYRVVVSWTERNVKRSLSQEAWVWRGN